MGCALSKQEEEDNVVYLCRERNKLIKMVMERRQNLADAHCNYNQSLYAVAAAIRLFVNRHSSSPSPFLISYPSASASEPTENVTIDQNCPQQTPTNPTHGNHFSEFSDSKVGLDKETQNRGDDESGEYGESERDEGEVCEHFYGGTTPPMPSPQRDLGWDFFNPFEGERNQVVDGFKEDLLEAREREGIPGLEEQGERRIVERASKGKGDELQSLEVIDTSTEGRELMEALKDIEDYFVKAYESGSDVSKMLEVNRVNLQQNLEEVIETSSQLTRSTTWNHSLSSRSLSCRSLLTSTSKSSSMWTDINSDLFDDNGGMEAGRHSFSLVRLYAWEKKLYNEVKSGEQTRKDFEKKLSQLTNKDARGDRIDSVERTKSKVTGLYTQMMVTIQSAESISKRIQMLMDEELKPQLVELLHGFMKHWKMMLESHETQRKIISEVKSLDCPAYGKFCNDSHCLSTLQLEAEIDNWSSCFRAYVSEQKAYVEALSNWISKFVFHDFEFCSAVRYKGPSILMLCRTWLAFLDALRDGEVIHAMKSFAKDIHILWTRQGAEQQQKRKVDTLCKELDEMVLDFRRSESKVLEGRTHGQELELDVRDRVENLTEGKHLLEKFRKKVDEEKAKHHEMMRATQEFTVNGFRRGFSSVFESLSEFSNSCVKMYVDLVTYIETKDAEAK